MFWEDSHNELSEYLKQNWIEIPKTQNIEELKKFVTKVSEWTATRMNSVSVALLLICSSMDCFGKLWEHFLCINLGMLENLLNISLATVMALICIPMLFDVSYLLMQRVHPEELVTIMRHEVAKIKEDHEIEDEIKWHLWSLDKSQRVCTMKLTLPSNEKTQQDPFGCEKAMR